MNNNLSSEFSNSSIPISYERNIQKKKVFSFKRRILQILSLPIILVAIYYLYLWDIPIINFPELRWFILLGMAGLAFFLNKRNINLKAAVIFWSIYGLSFLGAVISLTRAENLSVALWNTVGMGISFVTFLLFIPIISMNKVRQLLLVLLLLTGFLWSIEIQSLLNRSGYLSYSTFSQTGSDKNAVAFSLSLSSISLLFLTFFWRPDIINRKWKLFFLRFTLGIISLILIYYQALIYARSGLLTSLVGLITILFLIVNKSRKKLRMLFRLLILILIVVVTFLIFSPIILNNSPAWERILISISNDGINAFPMRVILIEKGLFIISQNPFIGVGIGGSRYAISSLYGTYPGFLIHNSFLSEWAEKGILSLVSFILWFFFYIKFIKKYFYRSSITDKIWLILFIPFFFQINFLDMNSYIYSMLLIFAGMYYERAVLANRKIGI